MSQYHDGPARPGHPGLFEASDLGIRLIYPRTRAVALAIGTGVVKEGRRVAAKSACLQVTYPTYRRSIRRYLTYPWIYLSRRGCEHSIEVCQAHSYILLSLGLSAQGSDMPTHRLAAPGASEMSPSFYGSWPAREATYLGRSWRIQPAAPLIIRRASCPYTNNLVYPTLIRYDYSSDSSWTVARTWRRSILGSNSTRTRTSHLLERQQDTWKTSTGLITGHTYRFR